MKSLPPNNKHALKLLQLCQDKLDAARSKVAEIAGDADDGPTIDAALRLIDQTRCRLEDLEDFAKKGKIPIPTIPSFENPGEW